MNSHLTRILRQRRQNLMQDRRIAILTLRDFDLTNEASANQFNFS